MINCFVLDLAKLDFLQLPYQNSVRAVELDEACHIFMYDSWAKYSSRFDDPNFIKMIYPNIEQSLNNVDSENWYWLLNQRIKLLLQYKPKKVNSPITLYKSEVIANEYAEINEPTNHWQAFSNTKIRVIQVPGDHSEILHSPSVEIIAETTNQIIKVFNCEDIKL